MMSTEMLSFTYAYRMVLQQWKQIYVSPFIYFFHIHIEIRSTKINETTLSCRDWHLPYSDDVVGVTSKECLTICGPGEGEALGRVRLGGLRLMNDLRAEFFHHLLAFQILSKIIIMIILLHVRNIDALEYHSTARK